MADEGSEKMFERQQDAPHESTYPCAYIIPMSQGLPPRRTQIAAFHLHEDCPLNMKHDLAVSRFFRGGILAVNTYVGSLHTPSFRSRNTVTGSSRYTDIFRGVAV